MVDRAGQQLGNYRLLSLLGQGGFAEVYLGEHVFLKKAVAIKVLYTQLGKDDLEGFLKEAQTIAHLEHPHIVRVTDFGLDGDLPYLVMEYAPNGTLRHRHPRDTTLPFATISAYVKQVADALQYAHDEKLVHRDIKPENMLLNRNNDLLLSDFGLATVAHRTATQNTQSIAGTAVYMAPELFRGKSYAASDQYALGIVVYEWLTGQPPFNEGDFIQLGFQHSYVPPEPLSEKIPSIPKDVEHVVMTALAKDPKQRFGSVKAFANALEQACIVAVDQKEIEAEIVQPAWMPIQNSLPTSTPVVSMQVAASDNQLQPQNQNTSSPSIPLASIETLVDKQQSLPTEEYMQLLSTPIALQNSAQRADVQSEKLGNMSIPPNEHTIPALEPVSPAAISRRTVLLGLGIAGLVAVGGGITWFVVSQKPAGFLYAYHGHSSAVTSVAWSPNGQRIASGSYDGTVQVWNASDGSQAFIYTGHSAVITSVAWSPDGQSIASGSQDKTVQVWNATDGRLGFTYTGHSDVVNSVAWSPHGGRIASGSGDKTVQVWDAIDGSHVFIYTGQFGPVASVAWSPDGKRIASAGWDNTVQVWNAMDGGHAFTYTGHTSGVNSVVWSPNGQRIASGSEDKTVQVWQAV